MISVSSHPRFSALQTALCLAPLAWLWFVLINDLRVEWSVNSQYSYGWAVPFLCAFLLWHKGPRTQDGERRTEGGGRRAGRRLLASDIWLLACCALLYAPTRLIQVANPGWRLISWALALEVIGITLCVLHWLFPSPRCKEGGRRADAAPFPLFAFRFSDFVFPICFFLVAVPWPTAMEQFLIQGLTRADASTAVEILGMLGIPAMPHGNVIEIATGTVGIDEACSGIRSFQATLMISLFLGEYYGLSLPRRALCVFAGFALSFLFNLARMTLLVWVAAEQGISAIAKWHDPAGVTILLGCFFGLWGVGWLCARSKSTPAKPELEIVGDFAPPVSSPVTATAKYAIGLLIWFLVTEFSVEGWYRWHEARLPAAVTWSLNWPTNAPAFKELPLTARTREILRYDEGHSASWREGDLAWNVIFLRWNPGRTSATLAENHTPQVCMAAAGRNPRIIAAQKWLDVAPLSAESKTPALRLPFAIYEMADPGQPFYVFYCLWNDRASSQGFETMGLNWRNRLTAVWAGNRNAGQRSVEIAVVGASSLEEAENRVKAMLNEHLISN